jgi:hypothetical protein
MGCKASHVAVSGVRPRASKQLGGVCLQLVGPCQVHCHGSGLVLIANYKDCWLQYGILRYSVSVSLLYVTIPRSCPSVQQPTVQRGACACIDVALRSDSLELPT